jgi:hypothetical protein
MKQKPSKRRTTTPASIAAPETLLKAAESAPNVFNIATYFRPLYVMRGKGYSWRYLADWLKGFNIEVSHVHLHRLYIKEDLRLDRLTNQQLLDMGIPQDMIEERAEKNDPTKRLIAVDPEDEMTPLEYEEFQKQKWHKENMP